MEKRKRINRNSLRWKMIPYLLVMALVMLLGYAILGLSANVIQDQLLAHYAKLDQKTYYERMHADDGEFLMMTRVDSDYEWADSIYKELYEVAGAAQVVLAIPWTLVCLFIPGALFYRRHLKKPLRLLMSGAKQIGENNLDFTISYGENDEMGQLCSAFEKMRVSLQENNLQMWRQMEERKRLNAAFAHDLRTPLTVLKGQADMLLRFVPDQKMPEEKIIATAVTMKRHIGRLEEYVQTMNHLQRLEDIEVQKKKVPSAEFVQRLLESGRALCRDVRCAAAGQEQNTEDEMRKDAVQFQLDVTRLKGETQFFDDALVMRVCDNLISNAARYAKSRVMVVLSDEYGFSVTVTDDGPGFSQEALKRAAEPFYRMKKKEEESGEADHMGMGLHICKVLCERHGGYLHLSNSSKKGACVRAGF